MNKDCQFIVYSYLQISEIVEIFKDKKSRDEILTRSFDIVNYLNFKPKDLEIQKYEKNSKLHFADGYMMGKILYFNNTLIQGPELSTEQGIYKYQPSDCTDNLFYNIKSILSQHQDFLNVF